MHQYDDTFFEYDINYPPLMIKDVKGLPKQNFQQYDHLLNTLVKHVALNLSFHCDAFLEDGSTISEMSFTCIRNTLGKTSHNEFAALTLAVVCIRLFKTFPQLANDPDLYLHLCATIKPGELVPRLRKRQLKKKIEEHLKSRKIHFTKSGLTKILNRIDSENLKALFMKSLQNVNV